MSTPRAYYNEIDPAACAVLEQLIADGVIAPGVVDSRSIKDVQPDDLAGFTQCHFFAGGGLWSVAARLAGWPDSRPIWTGSCPCQPFSAAGKGLGTDDPRHLWPDFHRLICAGRPPIVMGEQVAGAAGYGWLDGVRADLAGEGYASRGIDIPALAVDAPHERNRLYWIAVECDPGPHGYREYRGLRIGSGPVTWPSPVADDHGARRLQRQGAVAGERGWSGDGHEIDMAGSEGVRCGSGPGTIGGGTEHAKPRLRDGANGANDDVVDAEGVGRREGRPEPEFRGRRAAATIANVSGVTLGDAFGSRLEGHPGDGDDGAGRPQSARPTASPDGRNGSFWSDAEWIVCHDGKARRTKSGLPLLVDGPPGRVDLWRIGGNAIVPVLAAEVIKAFLDAEADERFRLNEVAPGRLASKSPEVT